MELLYNTAWEGLCASVFSSLLFFAIQWILGLPTLRKMQERLFVPRQEIPQEKLDHIVDGLIVRIVGGVHNTLQVLLGFIVLIDPEMWSDAFHSQSPMSQFVAVISAGFFLWDSCVCMFGQNKESRAFIFHGISCLLVYGYMAVSGHMHIYGCAFLMWEISTPFTQVRWLLSKMGLQDTKLFVVNGLAMMAAFFACRLCWGSYLTYDLLWRVMRYWAAGGNDIPAPILVFLIVANMSLNCLNCWWFAKMVKGAAKVFSPKKKEASKEG